MPMGPVQSYLCQFNSYTLPGYVQSESMDSLMNVAEHYGAYIDGSNSEDTGIANKQIPITLKVWEQDYLTCKQQVELAATMVRSTRTYAPLYIQFTDRHYMALGKSISTSKEVATSVRTLDYTVTFDCKPWLYGEVGYTLSGTTLLTTADVGRTIDNGSFTPTVITVTGTDVTVSGYTTTGEFTGFFAVSGAVTNLVVDTEAFTAKIGSTNRNDLMKTADYAVFVGPGETQFAVTGASSCRIEYADRWYL